MGGLPDPAAADLARRDLSHARCWRGAGPPAQLDVRRGAGPRRTASLRPLDEAALEGEDAHLGGEVGKGAERRGR